MNALSTLLDQRGDALFQALLEHIQISVLALVIAVLISVPLGLYLTRHDRIAEPIIGVTAVLQTIPSLALLGLLIPLVGIGTFPAVIALFLYSLLPIVRNTYTGIKEVDPSLIEASKAMGMNSWRRLIKVELPLALPVIMAGIRTAMVLIIGTATIVALIGAGGLGSLILLGIDRSDNSLILLGAIPAALLALIFDGILRTIEHSAKEGSKKRSLIMIIVLILILVSPFAAMSATKPDLVIGGKIGAEQDILINMYKELIEDQTDMKVNLRSSLGKTVFVFEALRNKEIDLYPEYTGTAIVTHLKEQPDSKDEKQVYKQAKEGFQKKFGLVYLDPMKFNNTYTLTVTKEFAKENNLTTISDLANETDKVKAGFTLEFKDREDGYVGIQKEYGLTLPNIKTMEPKLRYRAGEKGDINMLDAYATDPEIKQFGLKVLKDDQQFFPPYQGAPVLREDTLKEHPELKKILNQLGGKISDDEMREMNYQVNAKGKRAEEVAHQFLLKKGLIKK